MPKNKLVALSDGHGKETPGKRSPNGMRENEFNDSVQAYAKADLERNGFDVLLLAPTNSDTPLTSRTDLANRMKADILIDIHANANAGKWFDGGGIETYHFPGSTSGKRLATALHKEIIKGSPLKDRGVKSANFHTLRESNMPSALLELGFMDSNQDIKYLMSDAYRKECGKEITKAVCNYFGTVYQEETKPAIAKTGKLYKVQIGAFSEKKNADGLLADLRKKGYVGFVKYE